MISKVWVETPGVPVAEGDFARDPSGSVVCKVERVYPDGLFAHLSPVKRDGTRNYNWRGWSGNLTGYVRVVRK